MIRQRAAWVAATTSVMAACATGAIPLNPPASLMGCYELRGDLPESYSDSLGYDVPEVFQLSDWGGRWSVFPTSFEWHPYWAAYDNLPSTVLKQRIKGPPHVIPGDSVDIYFPGPIGSLVLRVAPDGVGLSGRSEWVRLGPTNQIGPFIPVTARPASCDRVSRELSRRG